MMELDFTVTGMPIPKGSMRHIGNGRMVDQTKTKPWMNAIRVASLEAAAAVVEPGHIEPFLIDVPVRVEIKFYFPRPAAAKNRLYPHKRSVGDIDKLSRAVLDALQPNKTDIGILMDDSLVVDLRACKVYTDSGAAGAWIVVKELI
jgi:crossover junction endodeoxyribonuclease RusA